MRGDPLTDVVLLAGARFRMSGSLAAGGDWALRFPPPEDIKFVAVVKGGCWLSVEGAEDPRRLGTGDVAMLGAGRPFALAGAPGAPEMDGARVFADAIGNVASVGDGSGFLAIGGHVVLDPVRGGVLAEVLPPLIHVDAGSSEAAAMRWIIDQLVKEVAADLPGAALASEQLAQLLFLHVIRSWLAGSDRTGLGWIGALRDARIAPALRMMHADPGRAWRLDELARAVGMSRTSFALRFKAAAGVAPLAYLLDWRMRLAERSLREGTAPVSQLALSLGYTSESAFSNAFKRRTGLAPRHYRSRAEGEVLPAAPR
ncbi:AraC family transcriptional regulator [Arenibaculum pallidiluteum]|uniref:AraC family transcriptional regulator n=1 Tax=Arenibaculum pallidiluteum TaxID=2812559 RepID=UPI001A970C38|nr:AraC family transcriptional regulator [Arenibaculum pallidiluteum]